jgi:AcrR family transcriptional regulator
MNAAQPPGKRPSKNPETLSRSARKDLTRASLLQAALNLMGEGRSFTSLGLREIAREAGVVPNAFYRHFRNTDELGLVLVEEAGSRCAACCARHARWTWRRATCCGVRSRSTRST